MQSRHVLTILAARDVPTLARFYREVFSWVVTIDTYEYVELELPGEQRLGLAARSGDGDEREAAHPFELHLEVIDIAIATERLLAAGARVLSVAPIRTTDGAAYFADPEGNALAISARKDVKSPAGKYTRDEFVRRVADVVVRSGVADAQTLVRDLENAVHFPMLARCGIESAVHWGARCVLLPGHEGYCQAANGARWTRFSSSDGE